METRDTDDGRPGPEADLVRRLTGGDADAWEAFVDGYGGLLTAIVRRLLLGRTGRAAGPDVDEIVAEVFLALWRDDRRLLRRYDARWRLGTWLGVLARVEVGRWLRRRRRAPAGGVAGPGATADGDAAQAAVRREAAGRLAVALARLGDRDRLLLLLRFHHGRSYAEIAEALDLEEGSIGPLLHRARGRLEILLADPPDVPPETGIDSGA